jgi:prepilin-type N-terminal cleavage/methylation domain-containing protein
MKTKKTRVSGFTLVELIVVIAIIAILASVSIFGFQSYISKARLSNDTTDAKNMTNIIQAYMLQHNMEEIDPGEIYGIVNIDNDYSLIPRVEGYSFWYNEDTKTIEVGSSYDAMFENEDFTELGVPRQSDDLAQLLSDTPGNIQNIDYTGPSTGEQLEELVDGYYLLDQGGSLFAEALSKVRNLKTELDYTTSLQFFQSDYANVYDHLSQNFKFDETLFINDFFGITAETNDDLSDNIEVNKVVFSAGIETIPGAALSKIHDLPEEIRIPASVTVIEQGAFVVTREDPVTGAIYTEPVATKLTYSDIGRIRVEQYAFHQNDEQNASLKTKEGSVELYQLRFELEFTNPTTYFYDSSDQYLGKRVTIREADEVSEDSFIKIVLGDYDDQTGICSAPNPYSEDYEGYYCIYDDNYNITLRNTLEMTIPTAIIPSDYISDVGHINLLVMSFTETFIYHQSGSYLGTKVVEDTELIYYADELNWFWAASVGGNGPYAYYEWTKNSSTYEGSPFKFSYPITLLNPAPNKIFSGSFSDEADYVSQAAFLYADTNHQINFVDQRVKVYLTDGANVTLYGAHMVYRDAEGLTIVEAKGYDDEGKLIAKGILRFVKTYDSIPVEKPAEFS